MIKVSPIIMFDEGDAFGRSAVGPVCVPPPGIDFLGEGTMAEVGKYDKIITMKYKTPNLQLLC